MRWSWERHLLETSFLAEWDGRFGASERGRGV